MKEHGILFSAPLVKANRAGIKYVTRRLSQRWLKANPGDVLVVRETWRAKDYWNLYKPSQIPTNAPIWYEADGDPPDVEWFGKLRPSIFLPRWASRDVYPIVSVRAERLDDITEEDAVAEGMVESSRGFFFVGEVEGDGTYGFRTARIAYQETWARINGDGSWFENPVVARIEYKNPVTP